ncbi:peptidoglycan recognition protein [Streptomyces sp. MI02-7b]|uniref:peptidoglycan recognition protein family protein n=1 Tax=Streptomyces sp. MI02-7b TaxID=462941 RepID=UPI0029AFDBED|nr:peptidoglycan recognition protein [Streptomyces sp. MI02-7b]MDX3075314.1 peptidoglycan recognition protein [Streptomyces sp. MI02-7b]
MTVAQGPEGTAAAGAGKPVPTVVRSVKLEGQGGERTVPQRSTDTFGLVGLTWDDPRSVLDGTVQVRTRSVATGQWSGWNTVDPHNDDAPDPGAEQHMRGGSAPLYVGPSDGVQLKVVSASGESGRLPDGMRLELVGDASHGGSASGSGLAMAPAAFAEDAADGEESPSTTPGEPTATDTATGTTPDPSATSGTTESPSAPTSAPASQTTTPPATATTSASPTPTKASPTATPTKSTSPSPSPSSTRPTAPASTVAKPAIVSRAGWGADEKIREAGDPDYATDVTAVFVHHTDTAVSYDCSASASIVRSIYAYHVQAEGWRDIGYNALVDKCGTIFEGRYGGIDLPVIGAHTYGFNTRSFGIAVLGTYQVIDGKAATPITSQMLGSVAALAAWKLGQYKINPNPGSKTQTLTEGASDSPPFKLGTKYTFNAISGHRDGFATACPGQNLYDKLPTIRSYAAGPVATPTLGTPTGATKSGSRYYTKGAMTVTWKTTTPAVLVKRFEVLVDGVVKATTTHTATSAAITVPTGNHTVAVRAVHINNKTSVSASLAVTGDTTKPTFTTAPAVRIRNATVSSTSVPVTVTWKAADNTVLKSSSATTPSAATFAPTTTSWSTAGKAGSAVTYNLRATDLAGNYSTASVSRTAAIIQETSAVRTGSWSTKSSTSYLGGKSLTSSSKNAGLTWTFTGRSVGWVVSRASTSGQAYVYVDGVKKATVELKSSSTLYRQTIWSTSWSTSAKHTLKIVVVGTSGRPAITTDGITYVK